MWGKLSSHDYLIQYLPLCVAPHKILKYICLKEEGYSGSQQWWKVQRWTTLCWVAAEVWVMGLSVGSNNKNKKVPISLRK